MGTIRDDLAAADRTGAAKPHPTALKGRVPVQRGETAAQRQQRLLATVRRAQTKRGAR